MTKFIVFLIAAFVVPFNLVQAQDAPTQTETANAEVTSYSDVPFDLKMAAVPVDFKGHDFQAIHKALSSTLVKGEFETTAAFKERVALAEKNPLYGKIYASSVVAYVDELKQEGTFSPWSYDADNQTLKIEEPLNDAPYNFPVSAAKFRIKDDTQVTGSYTAQNAIGTKVDVTQYEVDAWDLILLDLDKFPFTKTPAGRINFEFSIKMEASVAQRIEKNQNLDILIIGRLDKPYVNESFDMVEPTLDRPSSSNVKEHGIIMQTEEIWLYDSTTGEIFNKLKPAK